MDWTNNIIKVEYSSHELVFLRAILAEHGDIVTFLPCKDSKQCFVRYSTPQGAESAYNGQNSMHGLRVSTVLQDSTLLNQYLTLHSSRFVEEYAKKWCMPKQEHKTHSAPRKRAYSEIKTQETADSVSEIKHKAAETLPSSTTEQRTACTPETAQTKTEVKGAPTSRVGAATTYRISHIKTMRSNKTSPPTRLYSPKTKTVYATGQSCRKLRSNAGLNPGRRVPSKGRGSPKQSMVASSSSLRTGRALLEDMHRTEVVNHPPCRKPLSKTSSLHGTNSDQTIPKEISESESATKTYLPFSKEAPIIPKHERSEGQPYVHLRNVAETSIVVVPPAFSMETKIELMVAGEKFIYDLKKLEDDPKAIIELLKLASAERGHWMVVAAFYRRRGNTQAAMKLMTELLEVLKCHDVPEDNMKPVYLMLSGCEADLAKAEKDKRSAHYLNAQTWLQKVYGTFNHGVNREGINDRPQKQVEKDRKRVSAGPSPPRKSGRLDGTENHPKRSYDVNKRRKYYHYYR